MDSLHIYELVFFSGFVGVLYMFLPQIKQALLDYAANQKQEYNKLQSRQTELLQEYRQENAKSKFVTQKWKKFSNNSHLFRMNLEEAEKTHNDKKLEAFKDLEDKNLQDLIKEKKEALFKGAMIHIKQELVKTTEGQQVNFANQLKALRNRLSR